jgi:hypothetical protein
VDWLDKCARKFQRLFGTISQTYIRWYQAFGSSEVLDENGKPGTAPTPLLQAGKYKNVQRRRFSLIYAIKTVFLCHRLCFNCV